MPTGRLFVAKPFYDGGAAATPPLRHAALAGIRLGVLAVALLSGCAQPPAERVICQSSDTPTNAIEHKAMADVRQKVGCNEPDASCSFQISRHSDGRVAINVVFFQLEQDSGQCIIAGGAVAEYLYSAGGEFIRQAHGGLSALDPAQSDESPQPASAD